MIGRNRRVRLTALAVFVLIAFLFYTRSGRNDDHFEVFHPDRVGGGSVIRPKLADIAPQAPPPPVEQAPEPIVGPEPELPLVPVAKSSPVAPEKAEQTTATSTTPTPVTTPTTPNKVPATDSPPTPAAPLGGYVNDEVAGGYGQGLVEPSHTESVIKIHWSKVADQFPISTTIQLPTGSANPFPKVQRAVKKLEGNGADTDRLAAVKGAAQHAWGGYREKAWGMDEIKPMTGKTHSSFNGWGASLVDALDTLWIMGLKSEFEEALTVVEKIDFTWSERLDIPLFETTIRYLGGLVAAYDVSGRQYRILLDKAVELGEVLYAAFDTPNRMPKTYYKWRPFNNPPPDRASTRTVLAELGSLSLEFTRLAQLTGEPKYYDAIARITDELEIFQNQTRLPGMWPTTLDASGCGIPPPEIVRGPSYEVEPGSQNSQPLNDGSGLEMQAGAPVGSDRKTDAAGSTGQGTKASQYEELDKDRLPHGDSNAKAKRQLDLPSTKSDGSLQVEKPDMNPAYIPHRASPGGKQQCAPQGLNSSSQSSQESYTLGGASDSTYEYLPKQDMLLGGLVSQYRSMYLDSAATAIERLLFKPMTPDERDILISGSLKLSPNYSSPAEHRTYVERFTPELEHLTCFAGGMFALGGVLYDKEEHVKIGSKLTDGCVWAYNVTATGVMPEGAVMMACDETWGDCPYNETAYWHELDPYEQTRTMVHEPLYEEVVPTHEPLYHELLPTSTSSPYAAPEVSTPAATTPAAVLKRDDGLQKRQIAGPAQPQPAPQQAIDPISGQPKPATPQQAPAAKPNQPELVQMGGNRQNNAHVPAYTPAAPLSHKDYVQNRIEEDRLPPGFVRINSRQYILRPEAIESVFYMYRITGDTYWRDAGWNMFTSIEQHTRALYGASAIDDVTKTAPTLKDEMESFWLAETLKYFYLLFDEPERWSLDEWVLNTEAHFFRRPGYEFAERVGEGASEDGKASGWKAKVKRALFGT